MRKKQRKAFAAYVRRMANEMGLRDWLIDIAYSDDDQIGDPQKIGSRDAVWVAINYCPPHQKVCELTFRPEIVDWSPDRLRHVVCHELLHCHLTPLCDLVRNDIDGQLAEQAQIVFQRGFTRHMEWAVDGISAEWARKFPHMKWPPRKKSAR